MLPAAPAQVALSLPGVCSGPAWTPTRALQAKVQGKKAGEPGEGTVGGEEDREDLRPAVGAGPRLRQPLPQDR